MVKQCISASLVLAGIFCCIGCGGGGGGGSSAVSGYTVTYDGNGATGGNVPVDGAGYQKGASVTVSGNTGSLVKKGYALRGWNTKADGTGSSYALTGSATFVMEDKDVTLYAVWVEVWAKSVISGTDPSVFSVVAVDGKGQIFVAGEIDGTGTYDFGNGVKVAGSSIFANVLLVKYDASGEAQWARSVVSGSGRSELYGIAVNESGDIYVSGIVAGTGAYSFGNGVTAAGTASTNALLLKYNSSGTAEWAKSISGGTDTCYFNKISFDPDGNVIVAGRIGGTGTYSFGNSVTAAGTANSTNALLVKYDASGTAQWAKSVVSGSADSALYGVAVDANGNVLACGEINTTGTLGFGNSVTVAGVASRNILVVKYDSAGTAQWAQSIHKGTYSSYFSDVDVDGDGNVYTAGCLGGLPILVKYDANGVSSWVSAGVGSGGGELFSVEVASDGSVYCAGNICGTGEFDFDNDVKVTGVYSSYNAVLLRVDSSGSTLSARSVVSGQNASRFLGISADDSDHVYAVGWIYKTGVFDFGGVTASGAGSKENALLIKY